jgi:hypothetical protein
MDGTGTGSARIEATEAGPTGAIVRTFNPFAGAGDMMNCEAEAEISAVIGASE